MEKVILHKMLHHKEKDPIFSNRSSFILIKLNSASMPLVTLPDLRCSNVLLSTRKYFI